MVLGVSTIARQRLNRKAAADREWDAIVIGEYERAFYGSQYASMAPLLEHSGIQLWLPEAGGPVGRSEDDEQLMQVPVGVGADLPIARPAAIGNGLDVHEALVRIAGRFAIQEESRHRGPGHPGDYGH